MRRPKLELLSTLILPLALGLMSYSSANAADDALFQALGKQGGIAALVDGYLEVCANDSRVGPVFAHSDIPHLREKLVEYICVLSGGPCEYTGDPMDVVHGGLNITEAQFNAGVENLQEAMASLNLPEATQNRLLAKLAPLRGEIIYR